MVVYAKVVTCVCNLFVLASFGGLCNYFTAILPLGGLEQEGAVVTSTIGLFLTELTLFAITLLASGLTKTYKRLCELALEYCCFFMPSVSQHNILKLQYCTI